MVPKEQSGQTCHLFSHPEGKRELSMTCIYILAPEICFWVISSLHISFFFETTTKLLLLLILQINTKILAPTSSKLIEAWEEEKKQIRFKAVFFFGGGGGGGGGCLKSSLPSVKGLLFVFVHRPF